jgi:hypothetical protein
LIFAGLDMEERNGGGFLRSPQRVGEQSGKLDMVAVPRIERGTRGL